MGLSADYRAVEKCFIEKIRLNQNLYSSIIELSMYTISAFEAKNAEYLEKLREVETLSIRPFPEDLLDTARNAAARVIEEYAAEDAFAGKVYSSIKRFRELAKPWSEMTETRFYNSLIQ